MRSPATGECSSVANGEDRQARKRGSAGTGIVPSAKGQQMVGYDYPLFDLFLTMLWFFVLVVWITTLIVVILDIFRSADLSGWGKAGWFIFVLILPIIGVIAYLLARGANMAVHRDQDIQAQQQAMRDYVRSVGGETTKADELEKLAGLRDRGVLTEEEFAAQKAQLLA
jgi:hypothetical protein